MSFLGNKPYTMKKYFIVLLLALCALHTHAQEAAGFQKLSPSLQAVVFDAYPKLGKANAPRPVIYTTDKNNQKWYRVLIYGNNISELMRQERGVELRSVHQNRFAAALVTAEGLKNCAEKNCARYIVAAQKMQILDDEANGWSGVDLLQKGLLNNTNYDGSGTIVGLIDTGIDFTHLDFRNKNDSSTRLLAIWDQNLVKTGAEKTPFNRYGAAMPYNYGVEYTNTELNNELDGTPAGFVRHIDYAGHGTGVSGIATGNGAASINKNKYIGGAPNAEIIMVSTSFYDSDIIDALQYLDKKATTAGKPLVVNMSLGTQFGGHEGAGSLDTAVSIFTNNGLKAGRLVVAAAGNSGSNNNGIHAQGTLNENSSNTITFTQPAYTPSTYVSDNYVLFQAWFDNADLVNATVTSPTGIIYTINANGYGFGANRADGRIYIENLIHPNLNQRYITVSIDDSLPGAPQTVAVGNWQLALTNVSGGSGNLNYHVFRSESSGSLSGFALVGGNGDYTIASPATCAHAIAVGAFMQRDSYTTYTGSQNPGSANEAGPIWINSSRGPLRNGNPKPNLAAVGYRQFTAATKQSAPNPNSTLPQKKYISRHATSYACPTVTGGMALLLQQNPSLTALQAIALIQNNSYKDAATGSLTTPSSTWGYGKFDAYKMMAKMINASTTQSRTIINNDAMLGQSTETEKSINGTQKIAVRFSPSQNGDVTGIFYKTALLNPTLSDSISVQLFGEAGGLPALPLGNATKIAASQLSTFTWNFYHIYKNGYSVQAAQNYFIVISLAGAADVFGLRADTDGGSGNSFSFINGSWVAEAFDYRLRIVVSGGNNVRISPKMALQGCYNASTGLMNDQLRAGGYVPTAQPYTALGFVQMGANNEKINPSLLTISGSNAIVDWVQVLLRDAANPSAIVATRSALLLRNGNVVDLDGVSPVQFSFMNAGNYRVQVRHRNHLGACTASSMALSSNAVTVNFRSGTATHGTNAQNLMGGQYVLVSGDANKDKQVNSTDFNAFWLPQNGQIYNYNRQADFNMDTQVNSSDFNAQWLPNNSRQEQTP